MSHGFYLKKPTIFAAAPSAAGALSVSAPREATTAQRSSDFQRRASMVDPTRDS
jgi:hypothetical protein